MSEHPSRSTTVRDGLVALAKSLLLLVGVPATLVRLWLAMSLPGHPFSFVDLGAARLVAHLALGVVALGWLFAGGQLVLGVVRALTSDGPKSGSWSSLWALRLAALLLMIAAGAASAATSRDLRALSPTIRSGRAVTSSSYGRAMSGFGDHEHRLAARPQRRTPHHAPRNASPAPALPLELLGALGVTSVLLYGLARKTSLLRRSASSTRKPGERQTAPTGTPGRVEALLRDAGETVLLEWIDGTSRLLWQALRDDRRAAAVDVHLVRVGPDGVELRLHRPLTPAPKGFVALDGGRWWCLDPDLSLQSLAEATAGCGRFLPGLVPIGEDGSASYLLNLAPGRRLVLEGEHEHAARALRALVLALRTLPWADELAVELLDVPAPAPNEQCYQLSASSVEELHALADADVPQGRSIVTTGRLAQRWSRQPMVVAGERATTDHKLLLDSCAGRAGVISLGGAGSERLVLERDGAWLEPIGLHVDPKVPSCEQLALAEKVLLDAAGPMLDEPSRAQVQPVLAPGAHSRPPIALHPPGAAEVRLLCAPPRLVGVATDAVLERDLPRVTEAVAYLFLHGASADIEELRRAMFGGDDVNGSLERTHNVLAAARAARYGAAGDPLLARSWDDTIRLGPELTCDWRRFSLAVEGAKHARPDHASALLEQALALVGPGTCATSAPGYTWLVADGQQQEMLATIVDSAHHLAQLALAKGDTALARFAITRGTEAEPNAEMLARDLMVACDIDGDRNGMRRAFEALETSLAQLCGNEPSAETRELYLALSRSTS